MSGNWSGKGEAPLPEKIIFNEIKPKKKSKKKKHNDPTRPKAWTFDETVNLIGLGRYHWFLTGICGWANASDAVEVLCVSLVVPSLQCDMNVSSADIGLLTAVVFLGMMFGGYLWGSIGDFSGRRRVMISSLFINGIFGFASAFANNFWLFFFFRFVSGLGVGGSVPVIWSYFSEFMPSNVRGRMLSVLASFWMVGTLLTAGLAWILIPLETTFQLGSLSFGSWRIFLALSTFLCISSSVLVCFLPESPKYLLEKNQESKAMEILAMIYKTNKGGSRADFPVRRMRPDKAPTKASSRSAIVDVFLQTGDLFHRPLLWTTLIMLIINFSLSFGSYGLNFWLPELFTRSREAGVSGPICSSHDGNLNTTGGSSSLNCTNFHADPTVFRDSFLVNLAALPGNVLTITLLDRVGRKPFFFVGGVLSALSVFMIWFVSTQAQVLAMSCVFSATSILCWNCLDAFSTELFPTHLRATSMGACLAVARVGAILGNLAFGALIDLHCAVPILMVAAMLGLASLVSIRLKETKNTALA